MAGGKEAIHKIAADKTRTTGYEALHLFLSIAWKAVAKRIYFRTD